jgi:hypothetical protein
VIHTCTGCSSLPRGSRLWHGAYSRWYAAREQRRTIRAALWGRAADAIVRWS